MDFNFSTALELLKEGKKVARKGWNGQGMFLYYVPAGEYPAITEVAKTTFGEKVSYRAYLALKTVDGTVAVWSPSNTDILEADWIEVEA